MKAIWIKYFFCCTLLAKLSTIHAQPICDACIMSRNTGNALSNTFKTKYSSMGMYLDTTNTSFYIKKSAFKQMLERMINFSTSAHIVDGFRIYLAVDDTVAIRPNLMFVFSAMYGEVDVPDEYFIMNRNGNFEQKNTALDIKILSDQIKAYRKKILPETEKVTGGAHTNTCAYMYNRNLLRRIYTEIKRQDSNSKIDRIKFDLGAFDKSDINHFLNQIMIGFSFIGPDDSEYFEDEDSNNADYGCRRTKASEKTIKKLERQLSQKNSFIEKQKIREQIKKLKFSIGVDTGTPCPPNQCSGASLPKQ